MRGFLTNGNYLFETEHNSFEGEYIGASRASNHKAYYFINENANYRVTALYDYSGEKWSVMASRTDGSHKTLTRALIVPLLSLSPEFRPILWDEPFDDDPVEGLENVVSTSHYMPDSPERNGDNIPYDKQSTHGN